MHAVRSITGLVGLYTADSYEDKVWKDLSGKSNHTIKTNGNPITKMGALNGYSVVEGTPADGFVFPTTILPSVYTLFHIARYHGPAKGRIVSSTDGNWLSGHYDGKSGVSHHENAGFLETGAEAPTDHHGSNWVLSTDQNNLYRSNNVERGKLGEGTSANLAINNGMVASTETSDFQIAVIIVYNRHLTTEEIKKVEGSLAHQYNLPSKKDYPNPTVIRRTKLHYPYIIAIAVIVFLMIFMYMLGGSKTYPQQFAQYPQQIAQYPQQMMRGGGKKVKSFMKQLKSLFK